MRNIHLIIGASLLAIAIQSHVIASDHDFNMEEEQESVRHLMLHGSDDHNELAQQMRQVAPNFVRQFESQAGHLESHLYRNITDIKLQRIRLEREKELAPLRGSNPFVPNHWDPATPYTIVKANVEFYENLAKKNS